MKKTSYFKLQLKRFFKHYPSILFIVMLTFIAVGLTMAVALKGNSDEEKTTKVKVGIVGSAEDNVIGLAIEALKNMDSTRFSVDFIEMSESNAQKALKTRDISGYVDIPDNFVKDVYYGRETNATYVTLNGPSSLGPVLVNEITDVVKVILGEAQKATNGVLSIADEYNIKNEWDRIEELDLEYVKLLISRSELYEVSDTGTANAISLSGYYLCSAIMLMLLLWGIACNSIFTKKNLAVSRVLSVRGVKALSQTLSQYACFFIFTFMTCIIFAVMFGIVVSNVTLGIKEVVDTTVLSAVIYIFKIIPVIMAITAMQFFIYEAVDGIVDMVVIQFVVALGLGYISGCFYPNFFFPQGVQDFAAYSPSGLGLSYMRKTMLLDCVGFEGLMLCVYSVIFGALSVLIRKRRMAGDRQ